MSAKTRQLPDTLAKLWYARRMLEKLDLEYTDAYQIIATQIDEMEDKHNLEFSETLVFRQRRRLNPQTKPSHKIRLTVDVAVYDEQQLFDYASQRHLACWDDETWQPDNVGEAVLEALVLSNENP